MENISRSITDVVEDYINEYYELDNVLVIDKADGKISIEVVQEDAEVSDTAEVYDFPDLICFNANGEQTPDTEAINEIASAWE